MDSDELSFGFYILLITFIYFFLNLKKFNKKIYQTR